MNNRICYIALLATLLAGCSSTKTVTVEVPEASAVNTRVDSLLTIRPPQLPRASIETVPQEVRTFAEQDTSPASPVTAIVADRDKITVRTKDREVTYRQPATGETLVLEADTAGSFDAGVAGKKEKRTVETTVQEKPRGGLFGLPRWMFGVVVILALVLLIKLLR